MKSAFSDMPGIWITFLFLKFFQLI